MNLPDALRRALLKDAYDKGECDYSVTELIKPAKAAALEIKYKKEILIEREKHPERRLFSLFGQIIHGIFERANVKDIAEKRYFGVLDGFKISAQIDTLCQEEEGVLSDYKFTTAWKFKPHKPPASEFSQQLNLQLELLRQAGIDAKKLQIVGVLRDYSVMKAKREPDYPKEPVVLLEIPIWPKEETLSYARSRLKAHEAARLALREGKEPEACTEDERWAVVEKWAVKKKGVKTAKRVLNSLEEAKAFLPDDPKFYIEERRSQSTRCEFYCEASPHCQQYQKLKQTQITEETKGFDL